MDLPCGSQVSIKTIKKTIVNAIKDLDQSDFIDICMLVKSNVVNTDMVTETPRGTFIDLDQLEDDLLRQLNNAIVTKLQRIAER